MTTQPKRPTLREMIGSIAKRYESGNSIPITRAMVPFDEIDAIRAALAEPEQKDGQIELERLGEEICRLRAQNAIMLFALEQLAENAVDVSVQMAAEDAIERAEKEQ